VAEFHWYSEILTGTLKIRIFVRNRRIRKILPETHNPYRSLRLPPRIKCRA